MPELDRRNFLKVVGLSAGAAATVACKEPVEKIIPYLNQPEEIVPGIATYYASACRECTAGCGLKVKTREGRPIKVDGNPDDPIAGGALCVRGQASLYRTYDVARFRGPMARGGDGELAPVSWDEAIATLVAQLKVNAGKTAFLGGLETGTLDEVIDGFLAAIGSSRRVRFELFAHEALRKANELLFGRADVPDFAFDRSDLVVAFGTDWQETWLSPVKNQRGYSAARADGKGYGVYIGPRLSGSGQAMDQWLAPKPGSEILVALALASEVARLRGASLGAAANAVGRHTPDSVAEATGIPADKLRALAQRIANANAPLALPPGNELHGTNATQFAAAVQLLNQAAGAIGKTVVFGPDHNVGKLSSFRDVKELAGEMRGGKITMLLVHNVNPVYAAPQVDLATAMDARFVVSFSSANDETVAHADLVLPDHTPYEAWGDAEPMSGVRVIQQPTIRPLFDTRATGDVLLEAARAMGKTDGLPTGTLHEAVTAKWGAGLDAALQRGGSLQPAPATPVSLSGGSNLSFEPARLAGDGDLALLVYPSQNLFDGRSARIAMLQEIPNPVTKLVWGSYLELHPTTAERLGLELGDVVRVSTEAGSVELPCFPHEALREDVVAIEVGQGHIPVEPGAPEPDMLQRKKQLGVNALTLLSGAVDSASGGLAWLSAKAKLEKTGEKALLPQTQPTFDQEARGVAQEMSLAAFLSRGKGDGHGDAHGDGHGGGHGEGHGGGHGDGHGTTHGGAAGFSDAGHLITKPFDPSDDARDESYRWGLAIDVDACTGCNACITACAQENNIPTIGEMLVRQGREMHWIRTERYVEHDDHGDIRVNTTPMMCQHCGAAPCEAVCPVYATYHNDEGLNVMVPNRCIGTRYCGNNCPYKVRRFNYFPYDQRIREPENLALNPDVTVRGKGVMEKCTMCVNRIQEAKDTAILEGRTVRDGELTSACAQTCPSQAITFGNFKEPTSRLVKLREDKRSYTVLHHLNTRPGVTYLKAIRRDETEKA